jgi:SNF2 family DNA or RNA helicase
MKIPSTGQIVRVRTRHWLVGAVEPSAHGTLVQVACVDDDAQGEELQVVWEVELDAVILDSEAWEKIGRRDFDRPEYFAAYLNTLRWNCVTSTNEKLFQAPFRAGIRIEAYQLQPLRKALELPRVNLFIADDVGLGKTIESGLIANELRLRRRVNDIVVACPPSMMEQWQEELENRFGLTFEIYNRDYVERIRREHGYSTNPWDTFPRWIVSHRLLIDENYAGPMKVWLDNFRPGSLLILDEAHHAAPASGSKYAIDSKITQAIRDLAPRFEHRIFLSATPHNGHSNSFSALLHLLDNKRFTPGVPVTKKQLGAVMVRRLKEDIREIAGGFPKRILTEVPISGLPADAPELALADLLVEYRNVRKLRFASGTKREQAMGGLILSTLQQRLFSSIDAFHRTLSAHRRAMDKVWAAEANSAGNPSVGPGSGDDEDEARSTGQRERFTAGFDWDDERAQLPSEEQESEAAEAVAALTAQAAGNVRAAQSAVERQLLNQMADIAGRSRFQPDARLRWLLSWMKKNLSSGIATDLASPPDPRAPWSQLRVILFTEYEDTARYLRNQLEAAMGGAEVAGQRIAVFHGPTRPQDRKAIKLAFNEHPSKNPLRILIATDAAREGLNLQAHCWNLFHLDLPWNPSRLEQRNGRIDRKLQPNPEVYCHYFVYTQRPEDRVLAAIVRKTKTIRQELGALSEVIDKRLSSGIDRSSIDDTARFIDDTDEDPEKRRVREEEFEEERQTRLNELRRQIDELRTRIQDASDWLNFREDHFRQAITSALEIDQVSGLQPASGVSHPQRWVFPNLLTRYGGDSRWAETLDTLRANPEPGENLFQWRKRAPLRPVVFSPLDGLDEDVVQMHLSHRLVQRLLGRFLTQGFIHNDLSRACLAHSADAIPRVILIGRLSVYGAGAVRLHEEMLLVTARWVEPASRGKALTPYGREAEKKTLQLMDESLRPGTHANVPPQRTRQLHDTLALDIEQLLPHLQSRGETALDEARSELTLRGEKEANHLRDILNDQRQRVLKEQGRWTNNQLDLPGFTPEERKQLSANQRYWKAFLENVDGDLAREPRRIREFYQPTAHRIEPVGIAYLWPISG